ncbi:MAG: hypothetical protein OXG78_12340 [Chloroflexi bacterium]|nr:hypothetical protein [Chloroflexota bacterium]
MALPGCEQLTMLKRFEIFLGPRRFRAFVTLLAVTGLLSLVLNAVTGAPETVKAMQTLLLLVFAVGATYLIMGRLPEDEQKRWLAVIAPSLLVMFVGSLALPALTGAFVGAGLGWIVAGIFIFRNIGGPKSYKTAVKAMRKGDYKSAIAAMSAQITAEPAKAQHYRFRAELRRLSGDLKAARRDYLRMIELDANSAMAHNGLAEVELQAGRYLEAKHAAQDARDLAPQEWVAAYNLGMIEDRLQNNEAVIRDLTAALKLEIPDSRHRLLTHLYLWRAHSRLGDDAEAAIALDALRKERAGLEEWQVIMSADEATALREVLSGDVEQAGQLIESESVEARVT